MRGFSIKVQILIVCRLFVVEAVQFTQKGDVYNGYYRGVWKAV